LASTGKRQRVDEGRALTAALSETFLALGQPAASQQHLGLALTAWQRAGDRENIVGTHCKLGDLLSAIGQDRTAHEHRLAAHAIFEETGDPQARELRRPLEI